MIIIELINQLAYFIFVKCKRSPNTSIVKSYFAFQIHNMIFKISVYRSRGNEVPINNPASTFLRSRKERSPGNFGRKRKVRERGRRLRHSVGGVQSQCAPGPDQSPGRLSLQRLLLQA